MVSVPTISAAACPHIAAHRVNAGLGFYDAMPSGTLRVFFHFYGLLLGNNNADERGRK